MIGAICKWDVLRHPLVTIRSFGWRVFFRCLIAGRKRTFLSLLTEVGTFSPPETVKLVRQCVELELRLMRFYRSLATQSERLEPRRFFQALARQEESHAELLELCHLSTPQKGWKRSRLQTWQAAISRIVTEVEQAERELPLRAPLTDVLRLVLRLESSEINRLFATIIEATEADFVRTIAAFRAVGNRHIGYLCRHIIFLEPSLRPDCEQLRRMPISSLDS